VVVVMVVLVGVVVGVVVVVWMSVGHSGYPTL
jgi:hypothetical protein